MRCLWARHPHLCIKKCTPLDPFLSDPGPFINAFFQILVSLSVIAPQAPHVLRFRFKRDPEDAKTEDGVTAGGSAGSGAPSSNNRVNSIESKRIQTANGGQQRITIITEFSIAVYLLAVWWLRMTDKQMRKR